MFSRFRSRRINLPQGLFCSHKSSRRKDRLLSRRFCLGSQRLGVSQRSGLSQDGRPGIKGSALYKISGGSYSRFLSGSADSQKSSQKSEQSDEEFFEESLRNSPPKRDFYNLDRYTTPLVLVLLSVAFLSYLAMDPPDRDSGDRNFLRNIKENWSRLFTFSACDDKILPEELQPPYKRPLTLCVEVNDLLTALKWEKSSGWKLYSRPGMKEFLSGLSKYYEIVIFTDAPGYLGEPVCQTIDPHFFYSSYRLYREHEVYKNGVYVKDISNLNRNPSSVVILDVNPDCYKLQPDNGVFVKKWDGDEDDSSLPRLQCALEEVAVLYALMNLNDIRPLFKKIKSVDESDFSKAWLVYKNKLRKELTTQLKPSRGFFLMRNKDLEKSNNLIDRVEMIVQEERINSAKELDRQMEQLMEIQRYQEEELRKQLEENKKKGLKLWDYFKNINAHS